MHRCSVFKNSCINVPLDPISKMPKTAYERNEKNTTEQCSMESSTSCSVTGADIDAEKLKDFYRSIPDYNDINHLSESEFYSTLKSLREKKKLMLGIAVEHIDDGIDDKIFVKSERDICPDTNLRRYNETILSDRRNNDKIEHISKNHVPKNPRRGVRKLDNTAIENVVEKSDQMESTKGNTLTVKGNPKLSRPRRNHSACSISWHDDKVENKNAEIDEKFEQYFEGNRNLNDEDLYRTQSMPSSPLRTRTTGSSVRRRRKSITIPKPFKMTERDEENRIVNELRSLQKSLSEDMLHQKRGRKRFRVKPIPIESRIPLYDKILEDQAMRRAITKINSEAELRAQMKPFSFTKKEETGAGGMCARTANILPKCKKKKRFRARPVPKNLFSNYFYEKNKEDTFFRNMNRRIRAEEMLRNSSLPVSTALRDRSRLSTPAAHSDLPIDPSPAVPSVSSSDKNRSTSPTKDKRKTKHYKDDFITTSPRPFRFNTAERASKKINDISKKISQHSSYSGDDSLEKNNTIFDKTEAYTALDLKGIAAGRSNLAALLRAEAVRRKFEVEAARHLADQRKRAETKNRDRVLRANPAWHLVKNNHEQDIAMRLQTRRDEERMRREEFLHEMELMYGRVQQQPMLFERYYAPRSGATTIDSIQLSPRKSPSKKRTTRKSKSYHFPNPSISSEFCGDLLKYLDKIENTKRNNRSQLYEGDEAIDSLERE
ncbi:protein FAM161A [Vanessa atalanta]|uniref:protein FAM161A n=1 Tax=Vanessa atalanta TaxID=42275 RepID=UPI001FCD488C|nr:protein FAM161A [Vanessa atalanta]